MAADRAGDDLTAAQVVFLQLGTQLEINAFVSDELYDIKNPGTQHHFKEFDSAHWWGWKNPGTQHGKIQQKSRDRASFQGIKKSRDTEKIQGHSIISRNLTPPTGGDRLVGAIAIVFLDLRGE